MVARKSVYYLKYCNIQNKINLMKYFKSESNPQHEFKLVILTVFYIVGAVKMEKVEQPRPRVFFPSGKKWKSAQQD